MKRKQNYQAQIESIKAAIAEDLALVDLRNKIQGVRSCGPEKDLERAALLDELAAQAKRLGFKSCDLVYCMRESFDV